MKGHLKLALKVLRRRKVFTFISLFGITLTLVVLVTAAAIFDNVFAPRKPESRFDRVLFSARVMRQGEGVNESTNPGFGFVHDYVLTMPGIEAASVFSEPQSIAIYRNGARFETSVKLTDAAYWRILDFRFLEGRPFTPAEEERGTFAAVITDRMRERLFAGQQAVGKSIEIDGRRFTIIGVVPAVPITRRAAYADIWVPHSTSKSSEYRNKFMGNYTGIVLARSRADFPRLKQEFETRMRGVKLEPPFKTLTTGLDTLFEAMARDVVSGPGLNHLTLARQVFILRMVFIIIALLFMTLPALNLITLNLSRILERASEIGVRKAFGAPRRALVMQFVFENVVLTVIGGLAAFVIVGAVFAWISYAAPIPDIDPDVNWRIFAWGMAIAAFFGVFSGAYPAWRMSRLQAVDALRGGAQ
jgi:putative ABC transport system permease protein